jgi:hypothetical protein
VQQICVQLESHQRDAWAGARAVELVSIDYTVEQVAQGGVAAYHIVLLRGVKQDDNIMCCAARCIRSWGCLSVTVLDE